VYEGHTVQGIERHGLTHESVKLKVKTKQRAAETENKKIYPRILNVRKERSRKLASYDLEASPDDNMRGCVRGSKHFRTYAMGFGWIDEQGEQHYESFYGYKDKPNVCVQLLDFLYEKRESLNGYTLYAHNGGKYDFNIIMKEALMTHKHWMFDEHSPPIEQNSAWISAKLVWCASMKD